MPIADGAEFAGYTIIRLLGAGGMGEVYLAKHPRLPRLEALKILPQRISADPEFRQRFAREADMAASLFHPNIIGVHDRGEYRGQLWITMDFVDGTDAAQLVRSRHPNGMPLTDALEIVSAIADALDYAHERYLLHRDVKPANVLLTDARAGERRVMLADFGIAKAANETHGLTATNMTVGSVAYAAPEQLMGRQLDGRADQYALACTAFHLLAGSQPFAQSTPAAVIGSHLTTPPPRLSAARPDLASIDEVLAKAMAKEPSDRFDTCREFALALRHGDAAWRIAGGRTQQAPKAAPPIGARSEPEPPSRPDLLANPANRIAAVVIAFALVLAVGIVAYVAGSSGNRSPDGPTAAPSPSGAWDEDLPTTRAPRTNPATETPTPAPPPPPRSSTRPPAPPPRPAPPTPTGPIGDLGLGTPMSRPLCNGQGIVVLGNVTTPGQYAQGIQRLLNMYPGASYLRTDQACPSLRQADDEGDPIYTVYVPAGYTQASVCAGVRAAGGDAYGKWLDYSTPPSYIIPC
ncbi:serine/threonine protein kinase [Mycolicibacterium flavescens]|uniref:non-specific serine/threonine protein kinase n=1 Tax=Mycolicibacterium flavescens TaxID=1776 RepID=A0A1E3RB96_MYCFV|nr:serine/threonine-protein kinase [Mycolicibacterium flavescens]MCV7278338.1 serine/threonine protein kinase [Mycolicibacterium flavescens]ODQ87178.1 serine/threonine protein kinase [Mycolicibacterium flavescens]